MVAIGLYIRGGAGKIRTTKKRSGGGPLSYEVSLVAILWGLVGMTTEDCGEWVFRGFCGYELRYCLFIFSGFCGVFFY